MRYEADGDIAFAPTLPGTIIGRDDLLARLEDSRVPLTIVRGPSGSGKSTLIASWLRRHPRDGVWVSLDPSAARRLGFWQRIVDAVIASGTVPDDSALRGIVTSTESAAGLRGALLRGFTQSPPILLVLDDLHEVTDPQVFDDLHWLLQSGARLQVVIGTRSISRLEEPEQVSRVDTLVIPPDDLALSLAETHDMALALGADASAAAPIHAAFSGWALLSRAALLELAAGRASTPDDAIETVHASSDHLPFDLDPGSEYGEFLLRASVARRLTPALAAALGGEDAATHLARLERDGFGSWASGAGRSEFTIRPYLRHRLSAQLARRLPGEVATLRAEYAQDRIDHRDPMEAARQLAIIGDLAGIVRVVRRFYGELVRIHPDEIANLLRTIEPARLRAHPELIAMLLLDAARTPGSPRVGILQLASYGIASAQARFGGNDPVGRVALLMTLLAGQRLSGHYDAAVNTAEKVANAIGTLDDAGRDALTGLLPQALTHVGTTRFYAGELSAARSSYLEAVTLARETGRPWAELHADSMLSLVDATAGEIPSARERVDAAGRRTTPQGWPGTYTAAGYHLASAYLALEDFDSAAASAQLAELAEHESTIEHWPVMASIRAFAALADRRPYAGLARLDRDVADHADRPPTSRAMTALLTTTRIELLLADRQVIRAGEMVRAHRDHALDLARSRLALHSSDYARALQHATTIAWSDRHPPRSKLTAMLTVAIAAARLDQGRASREAAHRAVDLLRSSGLRFPLLLFPRPELASLFAGAGLDADELLAGVPDAVPPLTSDWRLTPAELRVLRALATTPSVDGLAAELHLSGNTIKTHLRQLYRKLGVSSRQEALGVAALNGLIEDDARD